MIMEKYNRLIKEYERDYEGFDFTTQVFTSEERIYLIIRNENGDDLIKLNFDYFPEMQYGELEFNLEYLNCEKYSMNEMEEIIIKTILRDFEQDQA